MVKKFSLSIFFTLPYHFSFLSSVSLEICHGVLKNARSQERWGAFVAWIPKVSHLNCFSKFDSRRNLYANKKRLESKSGLRSWHFCALWSITQREVWDKPLSYAASKKNQASFARLIRIHWKTKSNGKCSFFELERPRSFNWCLILRLRANSWKEPE